jgi:molybdenum cofactor biosynthesis protein B
MREFLRGWLTDPALDAVISSGGTGITDCMPEAAAPLIEHDIPGFATLFQVLSLQDIGSSGMLSRASAGLAGGKLLFLLPGSEPGSRLAMQRLVIPQLDSTTRPCSLAGLLPDE